MVGSKTLDVSAKNKGVVKGFLTSLKCTLTVVAGGANWFVSEVEVKNIDGGATKGPYETLLSSGG